MKKVHKNEALLFQKANRFYSDPERIKTEGFKLEMPDGFFKNYCVLTPCAKNSCLTGICR